MALSDLPRRFRGWIWIGRELRSVVCGLPAPSNAARGYLEGFASPFLSFREGMLSKQS